MAFASNICGYCRIYTAFEAPSPTALSREVKLLGQCCGGAIDHSDCALASAGKYQEGVSNVWKTLTHDEGDHTLDGVWGEEMGI